ncbi:hypothetical protein GCM10008171_01520 [Methylopila jiangsuensis]|uniref:Uncharacterized protein n=1 Tax=Methylopila jiangsuensis TaxID=586230 RepID=A0A9W6JFQ7_9HYPH|nr:hypothetical protein [Methylopila jiangsuensis]MDR6287319.1 hypothetical protein [Methylopila jiangsuensis]GLK74899.1 hypothetical protein GCM10008171_01520 [Methylopila jiangsuensis]
MTDDTVRRIRALAEVGSTRAEIAGLLSMAEWKVAAICVAHSIPATPKRTGKRKLPEWPELAIELNGATQGVVAARYGVSTTAISQARRKAEKAAASSGEPPTTRP